MTDKANMQTGSADPRTLQPNPWNTNRVTPENKVKLRRSITDLGFVSVVVVRELANGSLQILGGQHRNEQAIELGMKEVPILNLGRIEDKKAMKIGLVDNSRYGSDDTIGLAQLIEEIGLSSEQLAEFMPFSQADFDVISKSVDIDLDELDMIVDEDDEEDPADERPARQAKTHDVLKFRVTMADAERIRIKIEKTLKAQSLTDDDELTAAGSALAFLLLNATASSD